MKRCLLIIILILSFQSFRVLADTQIPVYVQPIDPSIASETATAVRDLISNDISENVGFVLVEDPAGAKFVLKTKVIKLGSASVIGLSKYANGKLIISSQLKAAKSEELDLVCKRLTRAVLTETPMSTQSNVSEVTQEEVKTGTNRKDTIGRWLVGFGPTGVSSLNNPGLVFGGVLGFTWEIVDPNAMVKLFWDGGGGFSYFALGADYFLSETRTAAFVGASFGYGVGIAQANNNSFLGVDTSGRGFAGGVEAGVSFFRTSKLNLDLALTYETIFANNPYGMPGLYGMRLELLF